MMNDYLSFVDIGKCFGPIHALQDIHLNIPKGTVLALLGPNGAGKSTLLVCLLGFNCPTKGKIYFEGHLLKEDNRRRFGYLAERVALYPHLTIWENGLFFTRLKNRKPLEFETQL